MSATIELKYFNSFWLKKMKSITDVAPSAPDALPNHLATAATIGQTSITFASTPSLPNIGPGQAIYYTISSNTYTSIIRSYSGLVVELMEPIEINISTAVDITFGEIIDFKYVPSSSDYYYNKQLLFIIVTRNWFILPMFISQSNHFHKWSHCYRTNNV